MIDFETSAIENMKRSHVLENETVVILENRRNYKMICLIHVYGRQHNATLDTAQYQVQLLWEAIKRKASE